MKDDCFQKDYERFRRLTEERVKYWLAQDPQIENWITTAYSFQGIFEVWFPTLTDRRYMIDQLENKIESAMLVVFDPNKTYREYLKYSGQITSDKVEISEEAIEVGQLLFQGWPKPELKIFPS